MLIHSWLAPFLAALLAPFGTAPTTLDPPDPASQLVLTDVRMTDRPGFDRLELEFSGEGTPGWFAQYVEKPVLDGSGDVVPLDGDAYLDVYASGTTWPADDYYGGPDQLGSDPDVYVGGTFEGTTQVLVGLDGARAPFRVFTLTHPTRLVVDIAD